MEKGRFGEVPLTTLTFETVTLYVSQGLWEQWDKGEGEVIDSCTIITTTPNDLVSELHNRMPVMLQPEDYDTWLDTGNTETDTLTSLLKPYLSEFMAMHPVSKLVNSPRNEEPECILPADTE